MKPKPSHYVEKYRIQIGKLASDASYGNNGAFLLKTKDGVDLFVIVSDGAGWEHASVSPANRTRCPTWEEMCFVKDAFWEKHETVVQYHPAEENYVNMHPYCLHLWKPIGVEIPMPPSFLVGLKRRQP